MSGLGGDGFYHVYRKPDRRGRRLQRHRPGAARRHARAVRRRHPGQRAAQRLACRAPSPPGAPCTPGTAGGRGRASSSAAIDYAREGFGATRAYRHFAGEVRAAPGRGSRSARTFLRDGTPPPIGFAHRPAGAGADAGARSPTRARKASTGARSPRRSPRAAARSARWSPPRTSPSSSRRRRRRSRSRYRGYTVRQAPPNSMGWVLLLRAEPRRARRPRRDGRALGRHHPHPGRGEEARVRGPGAVGRRPAPRHHPPRRAALEALRGAARRRHRRPPGGAGPGAAPRAPAAATPPTTAWWTARATPSRPSSRINSLFGSGVTAGDTGILLNNRMTPFHLEPGHPNRLAPGKRVRHTMNPPMVFKDGELWAVFGTPGRRQPGPGQPPGADRDDRLRLRRPAGSRDAALEERRGRARRRTTRTTARTR